MLLDPARCSKFSPSFDNKECDFYTYPEDDNFNIRSGECGFCKRPEFYRCLADITRTIPLSNSSIGDFQTCHYLYWLKKIRGIEVRPAMLGNPLKAGKLWDVVKQTKLGAKIDLKAVIDEYEIDPMVVARVRAISKAYTALEIEVDPGFSLQAKVSLQYPLHIDFSQFIPSINIGKESIGLRDLQKGIDATLYITGFYDRLYPGHFHEDKLSGRPEFYLDPFFIQSQNGTYFLADPNLEYCVEEVVQYPQQKSTKSNKDESSEALFKRTYDAILSTPSKYFMGWDNKNRRYGKKFFRTEFDLTQIETAYKQIVIEIMLARINDGFYRNYKVCNNILPGIACDYQDICRTGNMSEQKYKIREKGERL